MAQCDDRLDELRDELFSSEESSLREELWRQFINTYLDCSNHPERAATTDAEIESLAREIHDFFGGSLPGISEENTVKQLFALALGKENPSQDPSTRNVDRGADPVMMFNGQFVHRTTDVTIRGAGIDFIFQRTYKNQVPYRGPLGHNWDHNLNRWLRVSNEMILRSTGDLREEAYTRHPKFGQSGFSYWVPPDGQDGVIFENGSSFIWRAPDGVTHRYEQDSVHPFLHRVILIEDRHGNHLAIRYQGDRIHQVEINHPERIVEFGYDGEDRISTIQDHTGRVWRYCYDFFGDLVSFTTPATDRYPEGLTVCYEYSSARFTGELQHNLTRIIDPAGQMYLENEYGIEAGRLRFNRVIRQRQGGGEFLFEYEDIVPEFESDYNGAERPTHQTIMVERNGHPICYVYNKFGNLLSREEVIIENRLPRKLIWRYRYNRDGALLATLSPEGVITQQLYEREYFVRRHGLTDNDDARKDHLTFQERQGFGRLLTTVRRGRYYSPAELNLARDVWGDIFPDLFGASDPEDIVVKFTYEPTYGQLLTASDPRFTSHPDPAIQTAVAGEHLRYEDTLTKYFYTGPADDPASDPTRLLAEIQHPTPTLPDGALGDPIIEKFEAYDERGRLLRHVNLIGVVTSNTYFSDSDNKREGYLQRTVMDPDGLAVTTEYDVDELGRVVAVHLPRSVGAPEGHFVTQSKYNELDQATEVITSKPFEFKTRRFYDRNGKLEREEHDAKDEMGTYLPDAPEVRIFKYDEEFNLVEETIGGADLANHLVTRHCYDSAGQRVLTILPRGNQLRFRYDERLLPIAQTLGAGSEDAATTHTEYDGDGRIRRIRDARGNPTTFTLDPFGRVVAEEDALGHIVRRSYDKADNLTIERVFERGDDGSYILLARTETKYDELGRAIRTEVNRFDDPLPVGDLGLGKAFLESVDVGDVLVTQTFYDPQGRIERLIDSLGREMRLEYDTLDRVIAHIDQLGNRIESYYDSHGNLIRRDRNDLVRDPKTEDVIGHRFFSTSATYDEMDRMVTNTDNLGNVTQYFYDSRGNVVQTVDPLGNVVRTEFDIYGRRVAEIREQTETGLGGGDLLESTVTKFEYDDNSNLTAVIDARKRRTQYTFDALDRRRAIIYPDGSQTAFDYDPDGNLILTQDNNGLQRHYTVDALGRTTRADVDKAGLDSDIDVEGTTFEIYHYDGLDRRHHEENDFARCDIRFNSLGWPIEETIVFTTAEAPLDTSLVIAREFNEVGAVTGLTYPNGRRLRFHRDALDRLTRVENVMKGADYPGYSDTPEVYDIATMEYLGRQRGCCIFGKGARTSYAHDGTGRIIEIAHTSPTAPMLTLQYLFDAVGNMRFRNDIKASGSIGEVFKYDSFYRLVTEAQQDKPPFDTTPLTPADALPPDPIPDRQSAINALIGDMALEPATKTWDYDLVGNRESEKLSEGSTLTYAVNELDQYTTRNGTTFEYDRNGNLKSDGVRNYIYDYMDHLVRVKDTTTTETIVQFFHDARGRRILELRNGQATYLVCDGLNLIAEYRDNILFAQYVFDDGIDRPLLIAAEGNEYWYHTDLVGSVRILTDRDGNEATTYRYNPFGNLIEASDDGLYNPLLYTARRLDAHLDSYNFRARQYDPQLGRFLQRDPAGMVDGTNLYKYSGNNPLAFADPYGLGRQERASAFNNQEVNDLLGQAYGWLGNYITPFVTSPKLIPNEVLIFGEQGTDPNEDIGRWHLYLRTRLIVGHFEAARLLLGTKILDQNWYNIGRLVSSLGPETSWVEEYYGQSIPYEDRFKVFKELYGNSSSGRQAEERWRWAASFAFSGREFSELNKRVEFSLRDSKEEYWNTVVLTESGVRTRRELLAQYHLRYIEFGNVLRSGGPLKTILGGGTLWVTGDLNKAESAANFGGLVDTFMGAKAQANAQAGPAGVSWEFGAASGEVGPAKSVVPVRRDVLYLPVAPIPPTSRPLGTKPGRAWITVDSAGRVKVNQEWVPHRR